jgi:hypothetical protein
MLMSTMEGEHRNSEAIQAPEQAKLELFRSSSHPVIPQTREYQPDDLTDILKNFRVPTNQESIFK